MRQVRCRRFSADAIGWRPQSRSPGQRSAPSTAGNSAYGAFSDLRRRPRITGSCGDMRHDDPGDRGGPPGHASRPHRRALAAAGVVCLILAAGSLTWNASPPPRVAVMVDLSASTRTATYHDPAALERRLKQLLDATPYAGYAFAAQSAPADLAHLQMEMDGNQTVFDPPRRRCDRAVQRRAICRSRNPPRRPMSSSIPRSIKSMTPP